MSDDMSENARPRVFGEYTYKIATPPEPAWTWKDYERVVESGKNPWPPILRRPRYTSSLSATPACYREPMRSRGVRAAIPPDSRLRSLSRRSRRTVLVSPTSCR